MIRPQGFHAVFYRQMRRTPWWCLSLVFHAALCAVLHVTAFPAPGRSVPSGTIAAHFARPVVPPRLEEVVPKLVEGRRIDAAEEVFASPVVKDAPPVMAVDASPFEETLGARDFTSEAPFAGPSTNTAIGIGAGAGGAFGGRGGSRSLRSELVVVVKSEGGGARFRGREITRGMLLAVEDDGADLGEFPLKHTDVRAEVTAFLASVDVTQKFENDFDEPVEAVYVFPLPRTAAVNDFVMTIGDRTIRGMIREREEARRIYEEAKRQGRTVSLLEQERPNLFTQSVANLAPGVPVDVSIRYIHPLRMEDGRFELVFPTVVGPRYVPDRPVAAAPGEDGGGWSANTDRVPDGSRITPPVARPGTRAGHTLGIEVEIDAGVRVADVECPTHEIEVTASTGSRVRVALADGDTIPNRDFVLRFRTGAVDTQAGLLAHRGPLGGFFALVLSPSDRFEAQRIPRELVFVLDCSGSMSGAPLAKSKAVVRRCLEGLAPDDTFRVIRFSGDAEDLAAAPLPANHENVKRALAWVDGLAGGGGTEMISGIRAALVPKIETGRLRTVCFLTDGYIGNEREILAAVRKHRKTARLFSFGVGSSVNRYLLDMLAEEGRGVAHYVLQSTPGAEAAEAFFRRIATPALSDLEVDFGGIPVRDLRPGRLPDVFPGKPVVLMGRYEGGGPTTITVRGRAGRRAFRIETPVVFPEWEEGNAVLGAVWARSRIHDLMHEELGSPSEETRRKIVDLAIDFRLVTHFTSFVAVDSERTSDGAPGLLVRIPVEMPAGVRYSGVFGDRGDWFELQGIGLVFEARPEGLVVTEVREMSPAEDAGIEPGDLVRSLNGVVVRTGLDAAAAARRSEEEIRCEFRRDGARYLTVFTRK